MNHSMEMLLKSFSVVSQIAFITTIAVLIIVKACRNYFQKQYNSFIDESHVLADESEYLEKELTEIKTKCNACTEGIENCEYLQRTKDLEERLETSKKELQKFQRRYSWMLGNKLGAFLLYLANVDFERGEK